MKSYRLYRWADCGAVDVIVIVGAVIAGSGVVDRFRQVYDEMHCFRSLMAAVRGLMLGSDGP